MTLSFLAPLLLLVAAQSTLPSLASRVGGVRRIGMRCSALSAGSEPT